MKPQTPTNPPNERHGPCGGSDRAQEHPQTHTRGRRDVLDAYILDHKTQLQGWTSAQLARRALLPERTVRDILCGARPRPSVRAVAAMCQALALKPSDVWILPEHLAKREHYRRVTVPALIGKRGDRLSRRASHRLLPGRHTPVPPSIL